MWLSAAGAARATGAARSTIQRRLKRGDFPDAVEGPDGWRIPVADLLRAGYDLGHGQGSSAAGVGQERGQEHAAGRDMPAPAAPDAAAGGEVERLRAELQAVRHALELERVRREAAEALAAERDRTVELLARRSLTAGDGGEGVEDPPASAAPAAGPVDPPSIIGAVWRRWGRPRH